MEANPEFLQEVGKILVKAVVKEARKDLLHQGNKPTPRGQPEGIPRGEKFFKSFAFRIVGRSTIEIFSTWPWIEQIIEGRGPYRMKWLRETKGVPVAPLHSRGRGRQPRRPPGKVVFRTTPGKFKHSWLHPGFAKHNFIERAVKKSKAEITETLRKRLAKALQKSTNWT
jgi:hypothetical protein